MVEMAEWSEARRLLSGTQSWSCSKWIPSSMPWASKGTLPAGCRDEGMSLRSHPPSMQHGRPRFVQPSYRGRDACLHRRQPGEWTTPSSHPPSLPRTLAHSSLSYGWQNMRVAKLGTLMGVFIPCVQNIMGIIFYIRLSWYLNPPLNPHRVAGWGLTAALWCAGLWASPGWGGRWAWFSSPPPAPSSLGSPSAPLPPTGP